MPAFAITHAKPADYQELYRFVFDKPEPYIRRRSLEDVAKLIDNGAFFIATDDASGRLVGCSYVQDSEDKDAPSEFGGVFVDPGFRGRGIFHCLGLGAVVSHFANNPETPLMAHVVSANVYPVAGLRKLHFQITASGQKHPHHSIPGLEHMQPDADGNIVADEYGFNMEARKTIVAEVLSFPGEIRSRDGTMSRVDFHLKNFQRARLQELLAEFSVA